MTWSSLPLTGGRVGRWAAKCNKGACLNAAAPGCTPGRATRLPFQQACLPLSIPSPAPPARLPALLALKERLAGEGRGYSSVFMTGSGSTIVCIGSGKFGVSQCCNRVRASTVRGAGVPTPALPQQRPIQHRPCRPSPFAPALQTTCPPFCRSRSTPTCL